MSRFLKALRRLGLKGAVQEATRRASAAVYQKKVLLLFRTPLADIRRLPPRLDAGMRYESTWLSMKEAREFSDAPADVLSRLRPDVIEDVAEQHLLLARIDGAVAAWIILVVGARRWPLTETATALELAPTDALFITGYTVPRFRGHRLHLTLLGETADGAQQRGATHVVAWYEQWNAVPGKNMRLVGMKYVGLHSRTTVLGIPLAPVLDGGGAEAEQEGVRALVLSSGDERVAACERQLDAKGFPLPLQGRVAWARHLGGPLHQTALVLDAAGDCGASLGLSVTPTRALPTQRILRMESVGEAYATASGHQLLRAATRYAKQSPRILRAVVELECRGESEKHDLRQKLTELGYRRAPSERVAERTLAIDLSPSEDMILAGFARRARQNIRAAAKHALETAPIADDGHGPRMQELLDESLARTNATPARMDWPAIIRLCNDVPHRSRLVGVYRGPSRETNDLLGLAWGLHHGDRVEYSTGASARIPGVSIPILYPAIWDLIVWGKRNGGGWFDLGGVTPESPEGEDALGGISHFKRGFSKDEIPFGEEWIYQPSPLKSRLAQWSSQAGRRMRELRERRRASG